MWRQHRLVLPLAGVLCFYLLLLIVAGLSGDFPLNDDWSYGEAVRTYLKCGRFVMPTVCAAGFLHVLWGALFCIVGNGFSYEVLRFSSVIASAIGMLSIYGACRTLGAARRDALFCSLVYAANPILVNITLSFMSDSTGLAAVSAFLCFFLMAIKRRSFVLLLASSLTLVVAICIRQSAVIFAPVAVVLAFAPSFIKSSPAAKANELLSRIFSVSTVLLPAALSSYLVDKWLMMREANGSLIVNHYGVAREGHKAFMQSLIAAPTESWPLVLAASGEVLCYLALFLLPVFFAWVIPVAVSVLRGFSRGRVLSPATTIGLVSSALALAPSAFLTITKRHLMMPFSENIWRVTSTGALGIMGITNPILRRGHKNLLTGVAYAHAFWLLSCFLSICAASIGNFKKRFAKRKNIPAHSADSPTQSDPAKTQLPALPAPILLRVSVIAFFLLSLGFLTVETLVRCMDRYYLIGLAPALLLVCLVAKYRRIKILSALSSLALLAYVVYSLFSAQDYMASNRARWAALGKLETDGVSFSDIDGGAEYNIVRDMKVYSSDYRGESPRRDWRWWPINGEEYVVSFSTIPDYALVREVSYYSLLTQSEHKIYVLQKAK